MGRRRGQETQRQTDDDNEETETATETATTTETETERERDAARNGQLRSAAPIYCRGSVRRRDKL